MVVGIGKIKAAGLEGAARNIADIVNTACTDDIDHFFGFLIARIFALQGFLVERRDNIARTDSAECFRDGAGTLHIADSDRNDKKVRSAVGRRGIYIVFVEFRIRKNTEVIVHITQRLCMAKLGIGEHGSAFGEHTAALIAVGAVKDNAGLVVEKTEIFVVDLNRFGGIQRQLKLAFVVFIVDLLAAGIKNVHRRFPFFGAEAVLVNFGIHDAVAVEVRAALFGVIREFVKGPIAFLNAFVRIVIAILIENALVKEQTHGCAKTG